MTAPARPDVFDVAIIGGGVLGTSIAARLSRTTARICVLEARGDVAEGASKGNTAIAMSIYGGPGTLDARLIKASNPRWEDICARLDVPYRRTGGVIVALSEAEAARLPAIRDDALACGARAELVDGQRVRELEPLVSDDCLAGVWLSDEGVIDPIRLTLGYANLAARNGVDFRFRTPVIGLARAGDQIVRLSTPTGTIVPGFVINAAGVDAGVISALAGGEILKVWPRKGQFWLLDRAFGARLQRIVFPTPDPTTKGIQVNPTTHGAMLIGPSSVGHADPTDRATDQDTLETVFSRAQRLVPSISVDHVIKTYAANRADSDELIRVRFDGRIENLIHVSNRSTGVGTSPAIADEVAALLHDAGLGAAPREEATDRIPTLPRLFEAPDPLALGELDPRYGQIVCVCEQVSAAEIAATLSMPIAATSIEGVAKRTRATRGRCQGAVCMAGVAFMCSLALGVAPGEVPVTDGGTLGV